MTAYEMALDLRYSSRRNALISELLDNTLKIDYRDEVQMHKLTNRNNEILAELDAIDAEIKRELERATA